MNAPGWLFFYTVFDPERENYLFKNFTINGRMETIQKN